MFNEFKFSDTTKAQIAGRIEHVNLHGIDAGFSRRTSCRTARRNSSIARNPSYTPASASVGLIQNLPGISSPASPAQYVERAPKPAELFSRGAHDATATFDIGNPNLDIETAKSVEVGLRKCDRTVPVRTDRLLHTVQQFHLSGA